MAQFALGAQASARLMLVEMRALKRFRSRVDRAPQKLFVFLGVPSWFYFRAGKSKAKPPADDSQIEPGVKSRQWSWFECSRQNENGVAGYRAVFTFFFDQPFAEIDFSLKLRQSAAMSKPALGRGLGALLGGSPAMTNPAPAISPMAPPADMRDRVQRVPLNKIRPSAMQPRKEFSAEALQELADSIREQGIVQPLIVRERGGFFELIAGERRWRAAQLLNLPEVPVITREADDRSVLELALIENLQRENLNALEEALGYAQLAEQFQLTQEQIAQKVGKSRAAVANATRLLKLPAQVQSFVREGRLSVGHAKVILGLLSEKLQRSAADRVIKEELNVRQTEELVARLLNRESGGRSKSALPTSTKADPHVATLENHLREKFGTKVHLRYAKGKGALEIAFFSDDDLNRILQILGVPQD